MENTNNQVCLYLKFFSEKKYMDAFLEGKWYSNTVKYFRELEEETKIRGQGDANELKYTIDFGKIAIKDLDGKDIEINLRNTKVTHNNDSLLPLVCFVGIDANEFHDIVDEQGDKMYRLPFSDVDYELMEEKFGKYVAIIFPQFLHQRIAEINQKHGVYFRKIMYREQNDEERANALICGEDNRYFFKDSDLAYQREYRLCILSDMPNDHIFRVKPFKKSEAFGICSKFLRNVQINIEN